MINGKKVLAIIPARGGSKGIPKKNIIDILGKPLIQYTLDETKKSKYIDEIHISTDCVEIAKKVESLGFNIKRLRPKELAQDDSNTIDVLKDIVEYYETIGDEFHIVVLLQPTQPLRKVQHIDNALECFILNNEEGLASVSVVEQHPLLMRSISENGRLTSLLGINSTVRRQDFDKYFIVNGAIYINSLNEILSTVSLNDNPIPYQMGEDYVNLDIDEPVDLSIFKAILSDLNTE